MDLKPFCTTTLELLNDIAAGACGVQNKESMYMVAEMIKRNMCLVDHNHRGIVHAWARASDRWSTPDFGVTEAILTQQQTSEGEVLSERPTRVITDPTKTKRVGLPSVEIVGETLPTEE